MVDFHKSSHIYGLAKQWKLLKPTKHSRICYAQYILLWLSAQPKIKFEVVWLSIENTNICTIQNVNDSKKGEGHDV